MNIRRKMYKAFWEKGWPFLQGISSQARVQTCYCNTIENNADPTKDFTVNDGECFGHMKICPIRLENSCTDLAKRGRLPPLKDKLRKGVL